MVDFRRWITALAVLAIFAGLASAQVGGGGTQGGPLVCSASVAVPPALRSEGFTDLIGDIVLTCTGGSLATVGVAIPTANITVSLGTNVTSRILGNNGSGSSSEALLLIDEPGAGLPSPIAGFGPSAPQTLCGSANLGAGPGGCVEYAQQVTVNGGIIQVAANAGSGAVVAGANVFQGVVNSNQVTFQGIPILAPVSSGVQRIFRITNVRANVNGLGGGGLPGTTQLLASVSISGSTSVPINNPVQIAGFIQSGLTTSVRNADSSGSISSAVVFNQCGPGGANGASSVPAPVAVLRYSENFGTAFKTRVAPTGAQGSGQYGAPPAIQNIPGTIYNSESGFIPSTTGGTAGLVSGAAVAGLADYGTRLKAVFNSVPAGVRIFVSITNITNETSGNATFANTTFAQLINGEVSPDANGFAPTLSPTMNVVCSSSTSCSTSGPTMGLYEVPIVSGSGTAVWEVINTNPSQNENANFAVFTLYAPNAGNNLPPIGTATVNQSYAPTPTVAFSASAGAAASGSLSIPRFADTSTARPVIQIVICQTLLLFPFVTNQSGFDTGISIANTTTDPISTAPQAGTCTLSWYDGTGKTPNLTTPNVPSGTVYVTLASTAAPGFQGYMMALCNFQLAHGFAFISDIGARNLAMGYLALIVNNGGLVRANAPSAESLAH